METEMKCSNRLVHEEGFVIVHHQREDARVLQSCHKPFPAEGGDGTGEFRCDTLPQWYADLLVRLGFHLGWTAERPGSITTVDHPSR